MSQTKSSSPRAEDGDPGGSADTDTTFESDNSESVRQRVLQEVGLTSTAFIGPAFPPDTATVKSNIEDTLSEFYKELEEINVPDGADNNPGKAEVAFMPPPTLPQTSYSKEVKAVTEDATIKSIQKMGSYLKSSEQKQPSWPHWYQNEPYRPRRPVPGLSCERAAAPQNHWQYPPAPNTAPNPSFNGPPFHRPPPPPAYTNPQNPPSHGSQNWSISGMTNQYQQEPYFPTLPRFSPPGVTTQHSQRFYEDSPDYFDGNEHDGRFNISSDKVNVGWSNNRREEWCHGYERHPPKDSANKILDYNWQPPVKTDEYHSPLVLILMRGLPGSGKSTLARDLLSSGPSGLILSTDDYFAHRDGYRYDPGLLGAAHEWNQNRAKDAMCDGRSPVIIDNTNIQAWEMKPYVKMALESGYKVDFCEPDTCWKFDPYELERRNKHGVNHEKIAQMMDRFSYPMSVDIVMNSQEPLHVNQRRQPEWPKMRRKKQAVH